MMPDDTAAEACHDGGRGEAQPMNRNRSAWMAHWMKSSYKSASPACNRLGVDCELNEEKEDGGAEQHGLLGGIGSSMHAGAVGEAVRATSVTFNSEADNEKAKKACCDSKSFPTLKFTGKLDGELPLQREEHDDEDGKSETEPCSGDGTISLDRAGTSRAGLSSIPTHVPLNIETVVKECQVLSQEVLPTALLMKSPWDVEQQNLTVSASLWDDFVKAASDADAVPTGRSKGKAVMSQLTHEPFEICQSSYNLAARGRFESSKYHTFSSLLISEKKMSSLLNPQRSFFSRWMQGGITRLPHDSAAGSGDSLYFVGGKQHEIENYVSNPNITCQTESSEADKLQKLCGLNSVVDRIPCSIHDVESMKIYTSIDSVEESSRGRPKISQATHHILMSKNTDVTFSDRGQFFREPIAPIKFKGNAFNEILDFSPPTSGHALKLEGIGSSIKNGGKENVHDFKFPTCLKNESSAETDTMDIDALHKNDILGDVSFQTNKCSKDSQNSLTSKVATISSREKNLAKSMNTAIPDINEEPCDLLAEEGPVVDREASTSRTHSLELDHFLSHADEHVRSNSGNSSFGSDPSSRWVKRLKLGTLGSAHGTEGTRIGEPFSHEKVNSIFGKIMKDSKLRLEPKMIYQAEGQMVPHIPVTVSTNGKSTLTEAKKTVEITLSHPWIQRWSHNRAASSQKRHELGELHEQKSSNGVLEESQKKQFPSIAAMALMGKAMNSLNPSELMKKGPVIVWNMKGF
ncbi:hypothetical protein LR48_Vigan08g173500 [Vigna angularis]|uniref:F-box protein n=3 Tax=Phaseolus angularis TaxID=3914 RepID=A0A0L9V7D2_PHAAN|nr:F-box protein At2g16365 isoform X1 [Vigna angularis]XP_017433025.1 F-box protein At2g16365 isoform X1 [Vigna angularis]KAG2397910.1 F-box protein [Vigna angularis]KOM50908.1 hypothetical protein LR48_Vigan08g173500 [Vigna angularis]BAT90937.1 hypothetical protein VIGAN_06223400 [Vigna angularis var. angularis]